MAFTTVYKLDGKVVSRATFRRRSRARRKRTGNAVPAAHGMSLIGQKRIVSESLAVHPADAKQAEENARKSGFPTVHFDPTGRPHFDSLQTMQRYAKHEGYHHLRKSHRINY